MNFTNYAKHINDVCFSYLGHLQEYIIQLDYVADQVPLDITIHTELVHLSKRAKNKVNRGNFAFYHEFKTDPGGEHPIYAFIKDYLTFPALPIKNNGNLCMIYPDALFPSISLTQNQIESAKKLARSNGFEPIINGILEDAGMVIGAENMQVFKSARDGINTILVPSGQGTELFIIMFPNGKIQNMA